VNQPMPWSVKFRFAVCLLFSTAGGSLSAPLTPHSVKYPDVTIEHAELVVGFSGFPELAFLTIYNGSAADIAVTGVSVAGYKSTSLVRRTAQLVGYDEIPLEKATIVIPPRADLDMGRDTLFLSLEGAGGLPRRVTLTVGFDNGTTQSVPAAVLPPGSRGSSHHHGTPELE
jgi:hypothetical protein